MWIFTIILIEALMTKEASFEQDLSIIEKREMPL